MERRTGRRTRARSDRAMNGKTDEVEIARAGASQSGRLIGTSPHTWLRNDTAVDSPIALEMTNDEVETGGKENDLSKAVWVCNERKRLEGEFGFHARNALVQMECRWSWGAER